jgi:adenylate cyclase
VAAWDDRTMHDETGFDAWLETDEGQRWPIDSNCPIGRSPSNRVVIPDRKVSRRHAVVHRQDVHEFFLVDLGSQNGSYVNGLRVALPVLLKDGDRITLGQYDLNFHQSAEIANNNTTASHSQTLVDVKSKKCFMLLADIVNSTRLCEEHEPAQWASLVGSWTGNCSDLIKIHGGAINKYLGDGFLAIWPMDPNRKHHITSGLNALINVQEESPLPFRLVLHAGEVMTGGGRTLGEDSLSGMELVLLFRMERLASKLGNTFLCSSAVHKTIGKDFTFVSLGEHQVEDYIDHEPKFFYGISRG